MGSQKIGGNTEIMQSKEKRKIVLKSNRSARVRK